MATSNAINLNAQGMTSYDGAGTFNGRTLVSTTPNLTITNPDGISGNPSFAVTGFTTWTDVVGITQAMSVSNGYVADNASLVTFTLPSTAAIGDSIQILGKAAGGWKISQNATQQVNVGKLASTVGVGGSVASINQFDTIELRCVTAGTATIWTAKVTGNVTVV